MKPYVMFNPHRRRQYTIEDFGMRDACAYCGAEVFNAWDRIPPCPDTFKNMKVRFITVPCCEACISALGNSQRATYRDRFLFLYRKLSAAQHTAADAVRLHSMDKNLTALDDRAAIAEGLSHARGMRKPPLAWGGGRVTPP